MIIGRKIILRDKKLSDAWDDYNWEIDSELAHLDAAPVADISFSNYLSDYTDILRHSSSTSRRFAIETLDGKHIGNCSFYNINKTRGEAELGIMIGDHAYWNKGYGTDAVTLLLNYIFGETRLKRVHLKTLETNRRAQECFRKCGFTPCGHSLNDGYYFTQMEIDRQMWQEKQPDPEADGESR